MHNSKYIIILGLALEVLVTCWALYVAFEENIFDFDEFDCDSFGFETSASVTPISIMHSSYLLEECGYEVKTNPGSEHGCQTPTYSSEYDTFRKKCSCHTDMSRYRHIETDGRLLMTSTSSASTDDDIASKDESIFDDDGEERAGANPIFDDDFEDMGEINDDIVTISGDDENSQYDVYDTGDIVDTIYSDGEVDTINSDGRVYTIYSDGEVDTIYSDGEVDTIYSDGRVYTIYSDGEVDTIYSDGEVDTIYSDGKSETIVVDRELITPAPLAFVFNDDDFEDIGVIDITPSPVFEVTLAPVPSVSGDRNIYEEVSRGDYDQCDYESVTKYSLHKYGIAVDDYPGYYEVGEEKTCALSFFQPDKPDLVVLSNSLDGCWSTIPDGLSYVLIISVFSALFLEFVESFMELKGIVSVIRPVLLFVEVCIVVITCGFLLATDTFFFPSTKSDTRVTGINSPYDDENLPNDIFLFLLVIVAILTGVVGILLEVFVFVKKINYEYIGIFGNSLIWISSGCLEVTISVFAKWRANNSSGLSKIGVEIIILIIFELFSISALITGKFLYVKFLRSIKGGKGVEDFEEDIEYEYSKEIETGKIVELEHPCRQKK